MAHAGPEDAFNVVAGTTATYDDNVFRGRDTSGFGNASKSDMIYTAYAGVKVDKTYSLQRFQLDMTGTRYEYQSNNFLSFSAVDYRAAWLWSLTPSLTGVASATHNETTTNFTDFTNTSRRNVQSVDTMSFLADWAASGSWHLTAGAYQTEVKNSGGFLEVGNYTQNTAEAGIKYVVPDDSSIALVRRESRGDYSGRVLGDGSLLDTRYNQNETELHALWKITGHSSLDARIAYLDRTHEHYSQRDYSGAVGRLGYQWLPTGKLQFTLAAGRDLVSYENNTSSYYAYDYVSLTPAWLVTDKTTVGLKLDLGKRDFRGAVVPVMATPEETIRAAQLHLAWRPTPTIDVGAQLTHEQRSGTNGGLSYHDNMAAISAALKF